MVYWAYLGKELGLAKLAVLVCFNAIPFLYSIYVLIGTCFRELGL
jgi:hypothetical protein